MTNDDETNEIAIEMPHALIHELTRFLEIRARPTPARKHYVTTANPDGNYVKALRALRHRARPMSAGDIGDAIGVPGRQIYYAVYKLVKMGLVERRGGRPETFVVNSKGRSMNIHAVRRMKHVS